MFAHCSSETKSNHGGRQFVRVFNPQLRFYIGDNGRGFFNQSRIVLYLYPSPWRVFEEPTVCPEWDAKCTLKHSV